MKNSPQSAQIMGKGNGSTQTPKKIYVSEKELEKDNGSSLVFRSRKGTLHEIYGAYGDVYIVPPGFKSIYAIRVKIAGRAASIFEEP